MTLPFFGSVTRNSDLQSRAFQCQALPRESWATGDFVVCDVVGRPGPLYTVELPTGRMSQVFEGDQVVGAFGRRAATLEGAGDWEAIGDDGNLHALTGAGLFGKATSVSPLLSPLMELKYRGHVVRQDKVTMDQFWTEVEQQPLKIPTVLLIGTSMSSGKTTSGRVIIHELKRRGYKVTAAKLTGAARYRDVLSLGDAGADQTFDFVDVGLPSTVCDPAEFKDRLQQLLTRISLSGSDILVAEAGASPLEPYNGSVAMEMLKTNIQMLVLCASDPYAVLGVQQAFGREPDLVCGPAANTQSAIDLVKNLCGLKALNLLHTDALVDLNQIIDERFGFSEDSA